MNKLLRKSLLLSFFSYLPAVIFYHPSFVLYAYPEGWSDDILITPDTGDYYLYDPDVCTDSKNNVWVVWDSAGWGTGIVYYSKRDSLGNCLIPGTQVSVSGYSQYDRVAVDNSDNVHIIWRELSPIGFGIGYVKIDSSGSVLVPPCLAVAGVGASNRPFYDMAFDHQEKSLHIAWEEIPTGWDQITYTLLDSLGDTVVSRVRVSSPNTFAYYPGIGVDSAGNNHIAYRSDTSSAPDRLLYTKLDKYGNVLVPNKILTVEGCSPSIVCDRHQNVHIFYSDAIGADTLYYIKLDNDGNVLIYPTCLSIPTYEYNAGCHAVIDSQQFIHVVWEGVISAFDRVLYTKIDTLGSIIIPPIEVVSPPHTFWAVYPRIAADCNNRLHLVWLDGRIDTVLRVFYKRGENEPGIKETAQLNAIDVPVLTVSPNPFSNKVTIVFGLKQLSAIQTIELKIYDSCGRLVKRFEPPISMQNNQIIWDGNDLSGYRLPGGVYFLTLTAGDYSTTEKLLLIK
jgi:hypothetical protein